MRDCISVGLLDYKLGGRVALNFFLQSPYRYREILLAASGAALVVVCVVGVMVENMHWMTFREKGF